MMISSTAQADTRVVPSISVSEGYDSNPWLGRTPPGRHKTDFFTNVTPQVRIRHRGRLTEGTFSGQAIAAFYAFNPGINNVSTNGQMNFKLDRLVQTLNRNLMLSVTDLIYYTPQPPAFINPQAGQNPILTQSAFGSGVQSYRANTTVNTGLIQGGYRLSPRVSLQVNYTNTYLRFGATPGQPTLGSVFGATTHTISAGPAFQISPRDTVSLNYTYSTANYSGGGRGGTFRTQGGLAAWTRLLTPTLTATLTGGVQILAAGSAQVSSVQPNSGQPNVIQQGGSLLYTGGGNLLWNYRKETNLTLAFSRSVVPSFSIASAPLVTNLVVASVSHTFTAKLTAAGNVNYALNEAPSSSSSSLGGLSFTSYGVQMFLNYTLTRNLMATSTYSYYNYDSRFSGQQFVFNRHMLMVGLTATWN